MTDEQFRETEAHKRREELRTELGALELIHDALSDLEDEQKSRVLSAVAVLFGLAWVK